MTQTTPSQFLALYRQFLSSTKGKLEPAVFTQLKQDLLRLGCEHNIPLSTYAKALRTALIANREISLGNHTIEAILLYATAYRCKLSHEYIANTYSPATAKLVDGLIKAYELYDRGVAVETENFKKLLFSFAQDVRVIIIMIVERLDTMRQLQHYPADEQQAIAREVSYLYAPLAHRMGLYAIKTELEDLSLKFTSHEIYREIAAKLNQTKRSRDAYITKFIGPLKERLENEGLTFDIKGRTKSIYSIWNKMHKQQVPFEKVYDLFAIRIIIDCPVEREKAACWQAFSVVTDMYTGNTNRLRDWISMPKTNGYESLHITVMGPEGRWVEVQIRTRRMDEVAEKGVAAHWKYKGGKSDSQTADQWLKSLRDMLESQHGDDSDEKIIDEFKMQLYDDDVFVFTPKGDLHRLHKGATILDFAYNIHTKLGNNCNGAIVNNRHTPIKYKLQNGDQVEILTSPQQTPKPDWLNIAVTAKARSAIKQAIREAENREAEIGRETLLRRLKNWKMEYDDSLINQAVKKLGYKTLTQFLVDVNREKVNMHNFHELISPEESDTDNNSENRSTENFMQETQLQKLSTQADALIIDNKLKNVDYTLAKCCNPIYGDPIFGFVTVNEGIKIHRQDCPNAPDLIGRYGYRIIKAQWTGDSTAHTYNATLHIIGHDDIGIMANITSLISKEKNINMRSISVDTHDDMFEGKITLSVNDTTQLNNIIKKLKTVKGVKQITRS